MDGSLTRIFDVITFQRLRYPNAGVMHFGNGQREMVYGIDALWADIGRCAHWLREQNLRKGDHIFILAGAASFPWFVLDFGCQIAGVIPIIIPEYFPKEEIIHCIKSHSASYFFHDRDDIWDIIPESMQNSGINWVTIQDRELPGTISLESIVRATPRVDEVMLSQWCSAIKPEDTAFILKTSGSTGHPKSVCLSHQNILSNIQSVLPLTPLERHHRVVSFLPIAHIFERMVVYCYLTSGATIYFFNTFGDAFRALPEVKPHFFSCVPRILERMYDDLLARMHRFAWLRRIWIRLAIETGKRFGADIQKSPVYWLRWALIDFTVFRQWRRKIGGQVKGILVGAAPLNPVIGRVFSAARIRIREGYGMTETSPVISFNRFEAGGNRFGTAGIPIPGIKVRITGQDEAGNGSIEVSGPNVMKGYLEKEANDKVFTLDGWFITGDTGRLVHRRFLEITGRTAHAFKTSSGRFVLPDRISRILEEETLIDKSIIIGFQKPFVTALIYPNFTYLQWWCEKQKVHWTAAAYMVHNPKVISAYKKVIESRNFLLAGHEQVRQFTLLPIPWQEEELFTSLGKINPQLFFHKYAKEITGMYQNSNS
ncbi:MAG TPA: AMP-binding protein [Saprospiraceae bacterium]|nr:AMP-binding protein [Saprospiraceae bacterium]